MQGINSNDFGDLKSSLDMGFSSVVQMLNVINDNNTKSQKIFNAILDKLDTISDNVGKSFSKSIGKMGIGSLTNYNKLIYKVQLDIGKTIKTIAKLQKSFLETLIKKKNNSLDFSESPRPKRKNQDQEGQSASLGGKIINATHYFNFNLKNADKKTIETNTNFMKQLNSFMRIKDEKFLLISKFFTDINEQLIIFRKNVVPASFGLVMLSGGLMTLQFVSFINVLKIATILPILGIGVAMFITAILASTKQIGGGVTGMFKFYMLMKALPELFLNLGKGVLFLSIGLLIFDAIGYEPILKLTTTMIALGIAFKLMAGGDDKWTSSVNLFIIVGLILATTNALLKTQDIKWDSVLKLPAFIGGLGIALRIGGFDKMGNIKFMNMLSISLLLITLSLIKFKSVSWETVIKYNVFIAGLGLALRTIKKDISVMGILAMGLTLLSLSLVDLSEIKWMMLLPVIGFIGLLGVVVNKFLLGKMPGGGSVESVTNSLSGGGFKGGGLIGFAIGLIILTFAMQRFTHISWASIQKGIVMLIALGVVFKVFFQEKQTSFVGMQAKSKVQVPSMIGFALGMGLLVLSLYAMSDIKWDSVYKLLALLTAIGLIFRVLMPQKSKTSGMLGFALGVGVLLLALDAMTEIDWNSVNKLVFFMVGIGASLWLIKGTGIGQMLALTVAISVMTFALVVLEKARISESSVFNFIMFVGGIAGVMFFIGAPMFYKNILIGAGITGVIGLATYVLAKALQEVSNISFSLEGMLTFLGGIVILGLAFTGIGTLITGPQAILFAIGSAAVLVIAGVTYLMAQALSAISELSFRESSFDKFAYGIGKVVNAYISLDPIATIASAVTALAILPILLTTLGAIGILKLIDLAFSNTTKLPSKIVIFTTSLGLLVSTFNDKLSMWNTTKAAAKALALLPILGTVLLATLLLEKINRVELQPAKLGAFNKMLDMFVTQTVNVINKNSDALIDAQPGIVSITKLINVTSSLAEIVQNISSLRFTELGVKNGKIYVKGFKKLTQNDFKNVGNSIAQLLLALINPIKAMGMDNDTWRIGSDSIQNPFKNNMFLNGIDNIKKISEAFKPFVDSIVGFTKTRITSSKENTDNFYYGVTQTAKAYGYVFWKLSQISQRNLLENSFETIEAIKKYNESWEDLDYDSFKEYSNLFTSFLDKLADQNKWKLVNKNIRLLTANMQKMVKSINSIDLQKAAALEVNVKQLSDRSNINQIKEVIDQFIALFNVIAINQQQQTTALGNAANLFNSSSENSSVLSTQKIIDKEKNKLGYDLFDKINKGETSIKIDNLNSDQQKMIKEFDTNGDNMISNTDNFDAIAGKLDKLIMIFNGINNPWTKR